jgi:hypothetical protein
MTVSPAAARSSLSSWWKVAATAAMGIGFGVLILLTVKAYQNAPPDSGEGRRSGGHCPLYQR